MSFRSRVPMLTHTHTHTHTQLHHDVDLVSIATSCHGYSGADLAAVAREAALHSLTRTASHLMHNTASTSQRQPPNLQHQDGAPGMANTEAEAAMCCVEAADFQEAMRRVGPSIVRGMEVEVPHTRCAFVRKHEHM
eukprot:1158100-Pelagomonas_calceolata.AAC.8